MNCTQFPLRPEKVVAVARDTYLTPRLAFPDPANLPGADAPKYGQDITSSYGRSAPKGQSVGSSPAELIPKMRKLLDIFARGDRTGMATRLFNAFLARSSQVRFFDDPALNAAVAQHPNANAFCAAAMSIPGPPPVIWGRGGGRPPPHKKRIHEALKDAGWDIGKMVAPSDLGVPAFNIGSPTLSTEDFNNGLGLMINGVQYVYAVAKNYRYDPAAGTYCIGLRFIFYDVFGLDDDDLSEYGASSTSSNPAAIGITAWWQLQHQHGFAPLVTRAIVDKAYEAPAK